MRPVQILQELAPVARARQLRHTFIQGSDGKKYKVLTMRLYDFPVGPEFATHETTVEQTGPGGGRRVLVQPLLMRFFSEPEAMAWHQELLEKFDDTLHLKPATKPGA
jgi:hypothetical protein